MTLSAQRGKMTAKRDICVCVVARGGAEGTLKAVPGAEGVAGPKLGESGRLGFSGSA